MKDIFDKIAIFFYNLSIPTYFTSEIINLNGVYITRSNDGKWLYYWIGNTKDGYEVKVLAEEQRNYLRGRK